MRRQSLGRLGRWVVLVLCVSLVMASVSWSDKLILHDNFDNSSGINPEKWFGSETRKPYSIREAARIIAGQKLYMTAVGYGGRDSNTGQRTSSFGLGLRTAAPIRTLQAELMVTEATARSCVENDSASQGRAQLVGFFFNDGSRSALGDLTGDVVAVLEKLIDSRIGKRIRAIVLRCTSRTCHTGETIKALLFKHEWQLGDPDVLRIEWEPRQSQFVFRVNPETVGAETRNIAYDKAMRPAQPLNGQRHRIRVRTHGANCKSHRKRTKVSVAVDDVYLGVLEPGALDHLAAQAVTSVEPLAQRR